ncbi:MAG: rhodanese-like domain-containing protein [Microgenomates group bacterium]
MKIKKLNIKTNIKNEKKQKKIDKEKIRAKIFPINLLLIFLSSFFIALVLVKKIYDWKKINSIKTPSLKTSFKAQNYNISDNKIKEYLELEQFFYFDPLDLISWLKKPDKKFILLDVRDKDSYEKEHIKLAVNFQSIEAVVKLWQKEKPMIIIYGNYSSDPRAKIIAYQLIKKGIKTKILTIGYNEFRHLKILWLPQDLWDKINPEDFIE